jgi:hypothetical protein
MEGTMLRATATKMYEIERKIMSWTSVKDVKRRLLIAEVRPAEDRERSP